MRAAALLFAALVPCAMGYSEKQWANFTDRVKYLVKNSTVDDEIAVSLGYVDAQHNFSYAAGMVNETNGKRRPVNTEDTYLYGSGSKTMTAVAIMSLAERGALSLDDPVSKHVDRWLGLYSNTSIVGLWGERGANVTIRECLHMSSGIIDYDRPTFDNYVLVNDSMQTISPVLFIQYPQTQKDAFTCDPGTCRAYSSTGYVLLGLVLTAHSGQDDWTKVKTSDFWHPHVRARFEKELHFFTDEPLQQWLTVPGLTYTYTFPPYPPYYKPGPEYVVAEQNSSITGFTCANAVTNPFTMARFQYALLHEGSVVSPDSLKEMEAFEMLDAGWFKGSLEYGLGLMSASYTGPAEDGPKFNDWGAWIGHAGEVYGYTSFQAYYYGINATLSVVFNTDGGLSNRQDSSSLPCQVVEAGANILYNAGVDFGCKV